MTALLLAMAMCLSLLSAVVWAAEDTTDGSVSGQNSEQAAPDEEVSLTTQEYSGTCGDNLTWKLSDGGTLTISGSGKMGDYEHGGCPWDAYRDSIQTVDISNGVTSIGNDAFSLCDNLTSVTLPESLTSIGMGAFVHCLKLNSIPLPNSLTSIGEGAFTNCHSLTSVIIPSGMTRINDSDYPFKSAS